MTPQKKIYIAAAVSVIFNLLIIVFVVYPLLRDIENNAKELVSQKEKLTSLDQRRSNLENLKEIYDESQNGLGQIDSLLINAKVPVEFIAFLENTGREDNVNLKISSTASRSEKGDTWPSLAFQMQTVSPFDDFMSFLEKIESSPYLIKIVDLHIVRDGVLANQVKAIISIKVYSK